MLQPGTILGSKGRSVVRALASHHLCTPGANPGVDAICGLSLLLVLSLALRGFSPGTLVFPSPQKSTFHSTRNQVDEEPLCGCATLKSLFNLKIYLFTIATSTIDSNIPRYKTLHQSTAKSRYLTHLFLKISSISQIKSGYFQYCHGDIDDYCYELVNWVKLWILKRPKLHVNMHASSL